MLIAVLVLIGVDVLIVVGLVAVIVGRRLWLKRRPGEFEGRVRVISGQVPGLGSSWKRGFGRRVRSVLVWSPGPLLFHNVIVPVDGIIGVRDAIDGEVPALGGSPRVFTVTTDAATLEVATRRDDGSHVTAPAGQPTLSSQAD